MATVSGNTHCPATLPPSRMVCRRPPYVPEVPLGRSRAQPGRVEGRPRGTGLRGRGRAGLAGGGGRGGFGTPRGPLGAGFWARPSRLDALAQRICFSTALRSYRCPTIGEIHRMRRVIALLGSGTRITSIGIASTRWDLG